MDDYFENNTTLAQTKTDSQSGIDATLTQAEIDNQGKIKAAHIQANAVIIAAIITAITAIITAIITATITTKINENKNIERQAAYDSLLEEKKSLLSQVDMLKIKLGNTETELSNLKVLCDLSTSQNEDLKQENADLKQKYDDLFQKHQDLSIEFGKSDIKWLNVDDIFYQEGRHISGIPSNGWCENWNPSQQKDSLGFEHSHGIYFRSYREDTYTVDFVFDDDVSYVGFKGQFTLEYESRNTQIESNLHVYSIDDYSGEKSLLYTTPKSICGGVKPIYFDFPIYGEKHIRIEISSGPGEEGRFFLALADAYFYR